MPWTSALLGAALLGLAPEAGHRALPVDGAAAVAAQVDTLPADTSPADPADTEPVATDTVPPEPELRLQLGGALRFNIQYQDWVRDGFELRRAGDFEFDTFRLNADGAYGDLLFSAEYRFYAGYHMLHHGWVGYDVSDELSVRAGVHKVPFGALPYASHNWFFQLPYYVGLEDDYDAGFKALYTSGPWDVRAAFYMNDEGAFTGSSLASARYSYDVVPTTPGELGYAGVDEPRSDEEVNQLNGRVAYTIPLGRDGSAELGVSGQWGQLYNADTDGFGSHSAMAGHIDATYGRWNVIAEALRYELAPDPAAGEVPFVVMGAYDAPYKVARDAALYLLGLAYTIPVEWGPISSVRLYDDYTHMSKAEPGFADTRQNVLGSAISAGPLFVYIDIASGRNHPWLGPDYGAGLAEGSADAGWDTRFNVNVGYYF